MQYNMQCFTEEIPVQYGLQVAEVVCFCGQCVPLAVQKSSVHPPLNITQQIQAR